MDVKDLDTKRGRRLTDCGEFRGKYQMIKGGSEKCVSFLLFRTLRQIERRRAESKCNDCSRANGEHYESGFRILAGFQRVVPTVAHFENRAGEAGKQDKHGHNAKESRAHERDCIT